jgi:hypothetical protein
MYIKGGFVKKILISLAIFIMIGFAADYEKTFDVEEGTEIKIYNPNGGVTVSVWEENYIKFEATLSGLVPVKIPSMFNFDIQKGDPFIIGPEDIEEAEQVLIDYVVYIPENTSLRHVESLNGPIAITGTKGDITVYTANGEIEVEDVMGSIELETGRGDITVADSKNAISLDTGLGDIYVEVYSVAREDISFNTGKGDIEIYVDQELEADFSMRTGMGKVKVHDITLESGKMNGGGDLIKAYTGMGNIDLYPID